MNLGACWQQCARTASRLSRNPATQAAPITQRMLANPVWREPTLRGHYRLTASVGAFTVAQRLATMFIQQRVAYTMV